MTSEGKNGLKFSFGLKEHEELYSFRSTPRFPSIEIGKEIHSKSEKKHICNFNFGEQNNLKRNASDFSRQLGGGLQLLKKQKNIKMKQHDKMTSFFITDEEKSINFLQTNSVNSGYSLKERLGGHILKNKRKILQLKQKSKLMNRHSNSLANILDLKLESHFIKRSQEKEKIGLFRFKTTDVILTNKNQIKKKEKSLSPQRDTLKKTNKFFQYRGSTQNIEFRQTKKMIQTIENHKLQNNDKSKFFKNFVHRGRPHLKFNERQLNNQRIAHISKQYEQLQDQLYI